MDGWIAMRMSGDKFRWKSPLSQSADQKTVKQPQPTNPIPNTTTTTTTTATPHQSRPFTARAFPKNIACIQSCGLRPHPNLLSFISCVFIHSFIARRIRPLFAITSFCLTPPFMAHPSSRSCIFRVFNICLCAFSLIACAIPSPPPPLLTYYIFFGFFRGDRKTFPKKCAYVLCTNVCVLLFLSM